MRIGTSEATLANGREAILALRSRAEDFATKSLPVAAAAAETAGKRVSDLALNTSGKLSRSLKRTKRSHFPTGLAALPLLRGALRLARRHPVLVASGVAIAAVGYLALNRPAEDQQDEHLDDGEI